MTVRKIRSRLLVTTVLVLLASLLGSAIIANHAFFETVRATTNEDLASDGRYLKQVVQQTDAMPDLQFFSDFANAMRGRVTVIAHDGTVLFDTHHDQSTMDNHGLRPEITQARIEGTGSSERTSATQDMQVIYHAVRIDGHPQIAFVRVSAELSQVRSYQNTYQGLFLSSLAILLVLTITATVLAIRMITRPLEEIHAVVEQYALGNLAARSAVDSPLELAELSATMNSMAGQLQAQIADIESRRRQYSAILNSMTEGILSIDRQMTIIEANPAAVQLIATAPGLANLAGKRLVQITGSSEVLDACSRCMSGEGLQVLEIARFGHLFGETAALVGRRKSTSLRIAINPVALDSEVIGLVMTINDVTELKRLENIRKEFVANVSHELKTPITAIAGFTTTLLEGAIDDPESAKRFLQIINRRVVQMQHIVEDLLLLSSLEQQHAVPLRTWTSLSQIVDETLDACKYKAEEKDSSIVVSIENRDNLQLMVNGMLVIQALSNLVINALTYSEPGSTVALQAVIDERTAQFSVVDHGFGIPREALDRIFERFYRVDKARSRRQGGTGLGLSIVKHIVQVHGGQVSVESIEGEGSTFTIRLPRSGADLDQLQKTSSKLFDA